MQVGSWLIYPHKAWGKPELKAALSYLLGNLDVDKCEELLLNFLGLSLNFIGLISLGLFFRIFRSFYFFGLFTGLLTLDSLHYYWTCYKHVVR